MADDDAQLYVRAALSKPPTPGPDGPDEGFRKGHRDRTSATGNGSLTRRKPANSRELVTSRLQESRHLMPKDSTDRLPCATALECLIQDSGSPAPFCCCASGHARESPCATCGAAKVPKRAGESLEIDYAAPRERLFAEEVGAGRLCRFSECPRPENCSAAPALSSQPLRGRQLHRLP